MMNEKEYQQMLEQVREFLEVTEPAGDTIYVDSVTQGNAVKFLDGHWGIASNFRMSIRTRLPYLLRLQKAINHYPNWVK